MAAYCRHGTGSPLPSAIPRRKQLEYRPATQSFPKIHPNSSQPRGLTCEIPVANDAPFDCKPTNTLDLKDIKDLIALMRKNDLSVFKMEKEGFKITLKKGTDFQPVITTATAPVSNRGAAPLNSRSD